MVKAVNHLEIRIFFSENIFLENREKLEERRLTNLEYFELENSTRIIQIEKRCKRIIKKIIVLKIRKLESEYRIEEREKRFLIEMI